MKDTKRKKLKFPLENSPRWTASRGERRREVEDTKRKKISLPLRTVHSELSGGENFNAK